jgi:hypothetical protein
VREKLQSMPYFTLDGFLATFMTGGLQALIQLPEQGGKFKNNIHNLGVKNTKNAKRRQEEVKKELGYQVEKMGADIHLNKNSDYLCPVPFLLFCFDEKMGINEGVSIFFCIFVVLTGL